MKDRFAANNQKKGGQCKTIMNSYNFASIGKLEKNMFIMKYDNDNNKKNNDENIWFNGQYDVSNFDNFSRRSFKKFRDLRFEDDPAIKSLFTNERVRDLEQFIMEHEAAKGIDGDYDSDEEQDLLLKEFQRIRSNNNNNNKNRKRNTNIRGRG